MKFLCFLVLIAVVLSFASAELRKQKENPYEGLGVNLAGEPVIGIDLGTTYSCVALYRPNTSQADIIPNELGNRITPSVISFDFESGEKYVGDAAKNNAPFNPKNTFYDVKRLIGRRYAEVTRDEKNMFSYDVTEKDGRAQIKAQYKADEPQKVVAPEEISAMVLQKMKQIAEKYLNKPVKYAVVTVPAYFNDQQRQATKDAGKIAGLEVLRIINEPTAASMAYGLKKEKEHNILVFDLGGGTFDVSLVTIDNGVFEVVATSGDTHLGGEDFDMRVVNHFAAQFKKKHGKDLNSDKRAFQKLKLEAEKAKRVLSYQTETTMEIEKLIDGIDFSEKLTRAQFEALNNDMFQRTLVPVRQVLKDAGLDKADIDEVVLVGGSTRIPKIQELLSKFFDGKKLNQEVNPDEAVCYGAAVQGAILSGQIQDKDFVLIDVTPLSLGIETQDGLMATIIPRNTPIPSEKSDTFTTTSDYQTTMLIPIYEGERRIAKKNRKLGELELNEIPAAPRGVPQVKVIFKLDQNGILTVVAENQDTKKRRELTIQKGSLSMDEITRMKEDAQKNAEEDQKIEEVATSRQKLVEYVDSIKTQMGTKNIVNRMKSQDRNTIMAKLKTVLQWLKKGNGRSASKRLYLAQLKSLKRVVNPIISKIMNPAGSALTDDDILGGDFGEEQEEDPELADITDEDIQEVESGSNHKEAETDIEVEGKKDEL